MFYFIVISIKRFVCLFVLKETNISFTQERGGQTFYVGGGGAYDDVDEEIDVSETNIFVSEGSKLSAGARSFRSP